MPPGPERDLEDVYGDCPSKGAFKMFIRFIEGLFRDIEESIEFKV